MEKQVWLIKNGLECSIAHAISHGLEYNPEFSVEWYLNECRSLFLSMDIDPYMVDVILEEGRIRGLEEYAMGMTIGYSGAQISPSHNPVYINSAAKLNELLKKVK